MIEHCTVYYLENDKNLKHDSWRLEQLNRSTVDPSHPFRKFGTGRWSDKLHGRGIKLQQGKSQTYYLSRKDK
jgi:secreted Zn-dependent insulinase-like peptidase